MFLAGRSQSVIARALSFIGEVPGSRDPAFRFQSVESRIKRAGFDLKHLFGTLADVLGDRMTMRGSARERAEDEDVQGSLEEFGARGFFFRYCVDSLLYIE